MDGCHGGDPATSNRDPFMDALGYAGLNMVRRGLGFLCLAFPPRKSAYSHGLISLSCRCSK